MGHAHSDRFLSAFSRIEQHLRKITQSSKQDTFSTVLSRVVSQATILKSGHIGSIPFSLALQTGDEVGIQRRCLVPPSDPGPDWPPRPASATARRHPPPPSGCWRALAPPPPP